MPRFKDIPQDPDQMRLMPPSLDEMLSRDSEVRLLCEVMDHLDWSVLASNHRDRIDGAFELPSWHDFITCPWSNRRRVIWSGS